MNKKIMFPVKLILLSLISSGILIGCGGGGGGGSAVESSTGSSAQELSAAEQASKFVLLDTVYAGANNNQIFIIINNQNIPFAYQGERLFLKKDNTFNITYYVFQDVNLKEIKTMPLTGTYEIYDLNQKILKLKVDANSPCHPGKTFYYTILNNDNELTTITDDNLSILMKSGQQFFENLDPNQMPTICALQNLQEQP